MLHLALMSSENRMASALARHYPGGRQAFIRATQMSDGQIRFFGLTSIVVGLLLLLVWR